MIIWVIDLNFIRKNIHFFFILEQSGNTEHGRQIDLELNYEHNFNRPTFNMCKGQFGKGSKIEKKNEDFFSNEILKIIF